MSTLTWEQAAPALLFALGVEADASSVQSPRSLTHSPAPAVGLL